MSRYTTLYSNIKVFIGTNFRNLIAQSPNEKKQSAYIVYCVCEVTKLAYIPVKLVIKVLWVGKGNQDINKVKFILFKLKKLSKTKRSFSLSLNRLVAPDIPVSTNNKCSLNHRSLSIHLTENWLRFSCCRFEAASHYHANFTLNVNSQARCKN